MKWSVLSGVVGLSLLGHQAFSHGATVGVWTFDQLVDVTPAPAPTDEEPDPADPAGGETLYDSSGNNFNFLAATNFGTVALTGDRPALMPSGTFALNSNAGGAGLYRTPASDLFHRGKTGELTVEFWFKYTEPGASVGYVLSFNGGNGAPYAGDWGIYGTSAGALQYYDYSSGFPEVSTGALSATEWNHVAFTIDATGNMIAYLDGEVVGTNPGSRPAVAALADVLKFGASSGDSFAAHGFLIDELRISNVALLPGNGTGVGELAWNASLVPEPGMIGSAFVVAAASLLRRRRANA